MLVIRCDLFCTSLGFVWHIGVVFNWRMALELKALIIQSGTLKRNETKEYQTNKVRIPYCIKYMLLVICYGYKHNQWCVLSIFYNKLTTSNQP